MREGAVSELRRLLAAHDPGVAEAALRELQRLAEDDSRRVAAAAARVLAGERETEGTMPAVRAAPAAPAPDPAPPAAAPQAVPVPAAPREAPPAPAGPWPLVLAVLGALLVFVGGGLGNEEAWWAAVLLSGVLPAVGALAVVVSAVLRRRATGRRGLAAAEPMLAAFPLGLALAAVGLDRAGGEAGVSVVLIAVGSLALLASVPWRRPQGASPSWIDVGVVVAGSVGLLVATFLKCWGGEYWDAQVAWQLPIGIWIAALVGTVSVTVARRRGGGAWAPLVAATGGTTFVAALAIIEWATGPADSTAGGGPWLALLAGAGLAAAGVSAQLRR